MTSYGVMPSSLLGTFSMSILMPVPARSAISVEDDVSPAAPMSCMPTTTPVLKSSRHASRSSFSVNGSPTWTAGRFSSASFVKVSDAITAPCMPSRPVLEPT